MGADSAADSLTSSLAFSDSTPSQLEAACDREQGRDEFGYLT